MPYISTMTNQAISAQTEVLLKEQLGEAIALIPGKSESWLMLSFQEKTPLYFRGEACPCVYAEVKLFGSAGDAVYDSLTARLTQLYADALAVPPENIYVKYEEVSHWGWNGRNF